jgi:hypothetical protein
LHRRRLDRSGPLEPRYVFAAKGSVRHAAAGRALPPRSERPIRVGRVSRSWSRLSGPNVRATTSAGGLHDTGNTRAVAASALGSLVSSPGPRSVVAGVIRLVFKGDGYSGSRAAFLVPASPPAGYSRVTRQIAQTESEPANSIPPATPRVPNGYISACATARRPSRSTLNLP